jgi:hypothetical protein
MTPTQSRRRLSAALAAKRSRRATGSVSAWTRTRRWTKVPMASTTCGGISVTWRLRSRGAAPRCARCSPRPRPHLPLHPRGRASARRCWWTAARMRACPSAAGCFARRLPPRARAGARPRREPLFWGGTFPTPWAAPRAPVTWQSWPPRGRRRPQRCAPRRAARSSASVICRWGLRGTGRFFSRFWRRCWACAAAWCAARTTARGTRTPPRWWWSRTTGASLWLGVRALPCPYRFVFVFSVTKQE